MRASRIHTKALNVGSVWYSSRVLDIFVAAVASTLLLSFLDVAGLELPYLCGNFGAVHGHEQMSSSVASSLLVLNGNENPARHSRD